MRNIFTSYSQPKFTRGEKCICIHLLLTIALVLVLLIIYLVHIFTVDHSRNVSIVGTRRDILPEVASSVLQNLPIGLIYLKIKNKRNICNAFLVTQKWSICPGHCAAMRSDPELADYLPSWRIKYLGFSEGIKIKKSVVHPHFNRDNFANNIGLLHHTSIIIFNDHKNNENYIDVYHIQTMPVDNCSSYIYPVLELRVYEFCIVSSNRINSALGHGALIVDMMDNITLLGFFTWGETQQRFLPLIVLNLSYFQDWIGSVTTIKLI